MNIPCTNPKPRLLVIDDEPGIGLAIFFLLQDHYEVLTAETAQSGISLIDGTFSLILLDLRLPGVNGFDLLEKIHIMVPNTPVAILSAAGDRGTRNEALRHGAVAFIEKPFTRQELLDQISDILRVGSRGQDTSLANVETIRENPPEYRHTGLDSVVPRAVKA